MPGRTARLTEPGTGPERPPRPRAPAAGDRVVRRARRHAHRRAEERVHHPRTGRSRPRPPAALPGGRAQGRLRRDPPSCDQRCTPLTCGNTASPDILGLLATRVHP
ncbi:hypothetical protein GCM10010266_19740 [Streptomyces griseomycini]|nr:hypothetical protein GCM10010266_19740 [Streptomyces griseomycini]GGR06413.1 hypothetical protein GCM10015536_09120 [Streptomyces griseomycini]